MKAIDIINTLLSIGIVVGIVSIITTLILNHLLEKEYQKLKNQ